MYKGKVILTPFPFTDLTGQKVRPALVLYSQLGGDDCVVSFISSIKRKRLGLYDVEIKPTKQNGIKVPSVIKIDKIATLQRKVILGEIGDLESATISKVNTVLKKMFGI